MASYRTRSPTSNVGTADCTEPSRATSTRNEWSWSTNLRAYGVTTNTSSSPDCGTGLRADCCRQVRPCLSVRRITYTQLQIWAIICSILGARKFVFLTPAHGQSMSEPGDSELQRAVVLNRAPRLRCGKSSGEEVRAPPPRARTSILPCIATAREPCNKYPLRMPPDGLLLGSA